jgi:hypothetical protein
MSALKFSIIPVFMVLTAIASPAASAGNGPVETGCFARHINEAMALNRARLPLYSALTQGASETISNKLISYEKWTAWAAWYYDHKAKFFQEQGIPILCDEFISMHTVTTFDQSVPAFIQDPNKVSTPEKLDTTEVKKRIKAAYQQASFSGVSQYLTDYLADLEKTGPYHCMVRHILESVLRASTLAPKHMEAAAAAHIKSTESLSWDFITLQLYALSAGDDLDREAFPIHIQGVPIICQDVPKITAY